MDGRMDGTEGEAGLGWKRLSNEEWVGGGGGGRASGAGRGPGPGISGGRNADTACSLPSEDVRTGTGYVARSRMPSPGTPSAHESTSLFVFPYR